MKILEEYRKQINESFKKPIQLSSERKIESSRIEFLDLAKGICILLVVLYHCDLFQFNFPNFETYRIPLFILLSGIFFKEQDFQTFILKKLNSILFPLLFWLLISEIGHVLYSNFNGDNILTRLIVNPFSHDFLEGINGPLWFLTCLFFTSIIYFIISKITQNILLQGLLSLLVSLIGYILFLTDIQLPFWMDTSLIVIPFFFLGKFIKNTGLLENKISIVKLLGVSLTFLLIGYGIYYLVEKPEAIYVQNVYTGNLYLIYLNNIFLLFGSLAIFKLIQWLPLISYIGKNSLIVLCIHMPMVIYIDRYIERFTGIQIDSIERFLIIIIICWLMIPIVKTILPWFSGEKSLITRSTKKIKPVILSTT